MTIWNQQSFEDKMELRLKEKLGSDAGKAFFMRYTNARNKLIDEIYNEIQAEENSLTKHDSSHIMNVLKRVDHLLGNDHNLLSPYELYVLGIIILFHDVGNIYGREDHHHKKKVAKIYNKIRGEDPFWRQERHAVLSAVESHTGKDEEGNPIDALKSVNTTTNLENGEKIRLKELAAILRFGDECEEGPHRTSIFRQEIAGERGGYDESSKKYHEYSNNANVSIDRGSGRVILRCHINYDSKKDVQGISFREALQYAYERIIKLDDERKYTRYYSEILIPFKKTEATFHFSVDNIPVEDDLPTIELEDDIPIPGKKNGKELSSILEMFPDYDIDKIFLKVKDEVES